MLLPPDCVPPAAAILIVSDGMGGAGGGDVASSITVQHIAASVASGLSASPLPPVDQVLLAAIDAANTAVRHKRHCGGRLAEMGATAVCVIISSNSAIIANVGDSRCYLLRGNEIRLLTQDHSMVWDEMRQGKLTREEAERSRFRNVITRAIGVADAVEADLIELNLERDDRLLLCSDGLTTELSDTDIASIIGPEPSGQRAAEKLMEAVLHTEAKDNVTIVIADYIPADSMKVEATSRSEIQQEPLHPSNPRSYRSGWYLLEHGLLVASVVSTLILAWIVYAHKLLLHPPPAAPPKSTVPHNIPVISEVTKLKSSPVLFVKGQFRPDILAVDGDAIYLASTSGTLTGYDIGTSQQLPPLPGFKLDAPQAPRPKSAQPDVTFTTRGERFQIAVATNAVQEFNKSGVLIATSLGKGILKQPSRLAFVPHVGLMVLDHDKVWEFGIANAAAGMKVLHK